MYHIPKKFGGEETNNH